MTGVEERVEQYVTVLDSGFAPQFLALHRSLVRHAGRFHLWVLCMDRVLPELIGRLGLPDVTAVPLDEVVDDRIEAALADRSAGERAWTMTPFTYGVVFSRIPSAEVVTYLDADLWFLRSPRRAIDRFLDSGAAVMLTEHAYAPAHDFTAESGRYCVQFLPMRRGSSDAMREWWQERCLEWCYARLEDGRFGDQKYLDDWLARFPAGSIHVSPIPGEFQGPWNATRFPYSEAITYHFHGLRILDDGRVRLFKRRYEVPRPHLKHVYDHYLVDLRAASDQLRALGESGRAQGSPGPKDDARPRSLLQRLIWRAVEWSRPHLAGYEHREL